MSLARCPLCGEWIIRSRRGTKVVYLDEAGTQHRHQPPVVLKPKPATHHPWSGRSRKNTHGYKL